MGNARVSQITCVYISRFKLSAQNENERGYGVVMTTSVNAHEGKQSRFYKSDVIFFNNFTYASWRRFITNQAIYL